MKQLRHLLLGYASKIEMDLWGSMLNKTMVGKYFRYPIEASSSSSSSSSSCSNTNLQTLYGLYIPRSTNKYWFPKFTSLRKLGLSFRDGDLSNVKALLGSVTTASSKLEILRLRNVVIGEQRIRYSIEDLKLFSYENLFRMRLEGDMVNLADKVLPLNLTKLTLLETNLENDPMETLKKLPHLQNLKLLGQAYRGEKMVCAERGKGTDTGGGPLHHNFPRLQVLMINRLDSLKELIVEEGMMPQLNNLIIKFCPRDLVTKLPSEIENIKLIINH